MSILSEALHRADVWQRNLVDRNRDAVGNVIQDVSPAASVLLGRGWGDAAAFGLGALGSGIKHGSNIKDIGKSGLRNAAIGGAIREAGGLAKNALSYAGYTPDVASGASGAAAGESAAGAAPAASGTASPLLGGQSVTSAIQGAAPTGSVLGGAAPAASSGILGAVSGTAAAASPSIWPSALAGIGTAATAAGNFWGPQADKTRAEREQADAETALLHQRLSDERRKADRDNAWQQQMDAIFANRLPLARTPIAKNPYV